MATAEEILETMEEEATSEVIVVNNDLRTLTIPESIVILGVENDDDVVSLPFRMPRHFKEIDLGEFALRINYMNANGEADVYPVTDKTVGDEYIDFSWLVGKPAVKYKGKTKFVVCARLLGENDVKKEFNTTTASLPVLEGLEASSAVAQQNPDIIENILLRLNKLEVGGGSGGAGIDDETPSTETTYSSSKIDGLLNEKVGTDELNTAVEDALAAAKESGEFDGAPGDDYVLTEEDKQEIAGMVEGPSYTLPVATSEVLGGVKAPAATDDMTQQVGIKEDGTMWVPPGGGAGSDSWEFLGEITTEEEVNLVVLNIPESCYKRLNIIVETKGTANANADAFTGQLAFNSTNVWGRSVLHIEGVINKGVSAQVYAQFEFDSMFIYADGQINRASSVSDLHSTSNPYKRLYTFGTVYNSETPIRSIAFSPTNGAGVTGVGTYIKAWGVKA